MGSQERKKEGKKRKDEKRRGGWRRKMREKGGREKIKKRGREMGFRGVEERGYWGGQDLILITLDRHECFPDFHHLQKDKQRKQRHSLKLGKKRREGSKRNYYIISPRVIIKAIIIICAEKKENPLDSIFVWSCSKKLKILHVTAGLGGQMPMSARILEANALRCRGKCLWLWGQMPLNAWADVSLGVGGDVWHSCQGQGEVGTIICARKKTNGL